MDNCFLAQQGRMGWMWVAVAATTAATALFVTALATPLEDSALGLCEVAWHSEPSHVS